MKKSVAMALVLCGTCLPAAGVRAATGAPPLPDPRPYAALAAPSWPQGPLPLRPEAQAGAGSLPESPLWAVVATDVLNVRAGPGTDRALLGQAHRGESYQLRTVQGGWWQIDFQGRDGWIANRYATLALAPPDPAAATRAAFLVVDQADMLTDPLPGYDLVTRVKAGDALTYLSSRDGWVQVQAPDGTHGWLPGTQVLLWDPGVAWARRCEYAVDEGLWQISYLPLRSASAGALLRQAPAAGAAALERLSQGDLLKVVTQQGDWLEVGTAHGHVGWVEAAATTPAATPRAPRVAAATLRATAPGVLTLELTGDLSGAQVQTGADGQLLVAVPDSAGRQARLQVATGGVAALSLDDAGVHLAFDRRPDVAVTVQTARRLVLELRPALLGIAERQTDGGLVYHLALQGEANPVAASSEDGRQLLLTIPGGRLATPLPDDVQAEALGSDLVLHLPARASYALKRTPDGFDLVCYAPGLAGKVIMLDPGHGGSEVGAASPDGRLAEKAVNLDVQLRLKALLEQQGATVLMTRTADTRALPPAQEQALPPDERLRADLAYRSFLANSQGVDLFLSVHSNSSVSGEHGTETYYSADNLNAERSAALAALVQAALVQGLGRADGGVKTDIFCVTRFTDAPAVLAELAYLSDRLESALLGSASFRQQAAEALAAAVARFFGA